MSKEKPTKPAELDPVSLEDSETPIEAYGTPIDLEAPKESQSEESKKKEKDLENSKDSHSDSSGYEDADDEHDEEIETKKSTKTGQKESGKDKITKIDETKDSIDKKEDKKEDDKDQKKAEKDEQDEEEDESDSSDEEEDSNGSKNTNSDSEERTAQNTATNRKPSGVLEGMDPETGDYIRPKNWDSLPKPLRDEEKKDEEKPPKTRMGKRKREKNGLRRSRSLSRRVLDTVSNKSRTDDSDEEEGGTGNWLFGNRIRFTIMVISTLCLSSILSNILTFNFTFICMAGEKPRGYENMTKYQQEHSGYKPHLDYTSGERSALFMSVAVGSLIAVFPMTVALNKYGSRMTFGMLGLISAIATYLIPLSANTSFWMMLIMRGVQGVGFSACLPVMGSITSHWSTLKQNGIFIAILSSFLQIAPTFTMPISGELCTSALGWESVYYLHGTVCLILFIIFILYHRNSPHKHPMMNRNELVKVYFGKGSIYSGPGRENTKKKSRKVPYQAMYADHAIWAILVAAFGNFMGTQLSLQFIPTYLNKVLYLPIEQTGVASAISPVIMFFIKLIAGQSSDKITFISDEWKLRIYNSLSCGMMGVLFIVLALLDPRTNGSLCMVTLIASTCILGFNSGGFFKSSQMVSRQHSHFTLANIAFLNCVCMLIVPLLNEVIAPENEPEDWAVVLWIHGIVLLSTNLFFCFMCSGKPASWTMDGWSHRASKRNRRSVKRSSVQPVDAIQKPENVV